MNSTHKAEVVEVRLGDRVGDTLSLVHVWGYTCVVKTESWGDGARGAYIVPDTVVDTSRPEFAFLASQAKKDGSYRVRAKRILGVVSQGLLVPTDSPVGTDLYEALGCKRYEPQTNVPNAPRERDTGIAPDCDTGPEKYDIDAWERYGSGFVPGEPVVVQEKLDGSNVRAVWWKGRLHVKSRNVWVTSGVLYDTVAACEPLVSQLHADPGSVIFGEVYGTTNRLRYGPNRFAAFDLWREGWVAKAPALRFFEERGIPVAKWIVVPYSDARIRQLREGHTAVVDAPPGTIREGIVVTAPRDNGRLTLKAINPDFHGLRT